MIIGLIGLGAVIAILAMLYAYDASRDVFHPLMLLCPMILFLYVWMPFRLYQGQHLDTFFAKDDLIYVLKLNVAGIAMLVGGCLAAGFERRTSGAPLPLPALGGSKLLLGGALIGGLGLGAWLMTLVNVGGFQQAFGEAYSGGWDDNGYIRDGILMLLPGILLVLTAAASSGWRLSHVVCVTLFALPWVLQAVLTARRGPTFMFMVGVGINWFLQRNRRPPLVTTAAAGLFVGLAMLFLVANRGAIYLGSDQELTTSIGTIIDTPDAGNEFIYGTGTVIHAESLDDYYWGKRYIAQLFVRPIPSAIWPNKYVSFGVPELLFNAGTARVGFIERLGWAPPPGSAPGFVADFFIEFWYFSLPALFFLGWIFGKVWRMAVRRGRGWAMQYTCLSAVSLYLVMQTMEAVIFRIVLMSIPMWLVWRSVETGERATDPVLADSREWQSHGA